MDPAHEAGLPVAGATGLGMEVPHGRHRLADARAVLEHHLARLLC